MPEISPAPILVFQMAKVASRSWQRLLAAAMPDRRIEHFHSISDRSMALNDELLKVTGADQTVRYLFMYPLTGLQKEIAAQVHHGVWTGPPSMIVTGMRDPVARAVSAIGFLTNRLGYARVPVTVRDGGTPQNLRELFFRVLRVAQGADHQNDTLVRLLAFVIGDYRRWFQEELAPGFGLDVLAQPFDHSRHHLRMEAGGHRLFLYRVEDLQSARAAPVLMGQASDFFGCALGAVPDDVVAGEARYRAFYGAFKPLIRLGREDLDWFYDHPVVTAFYTPAEIERFRGTWAG
jgi:hypothetical protein